MFVTSTSLTFHVNAIAHFPWYFSTSLINLVIGLNDFFTVLEGDNINVNYKAFHSCQWYRCINRSCMQILIAKSYLEICVVLLIDIVIATLQAYLSIDKMSLYFNRSGCLYGLMPKYLFGNKNTNIIFLVSIPSYRWL